MFKVWDKVRCITLSEYEEHNYLKVWEVGEVKKVRENWNINIWDWMYSNPSRFELVETEKTPKRHTYTTIKIRDDGVRFEKDKIDDETIEERKKKLENYKKDVNYVEKLLKSHRSLFPKKK